MLTFNQFSDFQSNIFELSEGIETQLELLELAESYVDTDIETAVGLINQSLVLESTEESEDLFERLVKKVSMTDRKAGGKLITKQRDRKTRARKASQTTGLAKSKRKRRAVKAARTRKRDKSGQRKALKKRRKSLKKRDQLGL